MNKTKILTGVIAAAALCAGQAMAQSFANGDMYAAFGNSVLGAGAVGKYDVLVDLGSIASFQQPNAVSSTTFSQVSSALSSVYGAGNLGSVYWTVFGVNDTTTTPYNASVSQTDPNTIWNTLARSNPGIKNATPLVGGGSSSQNIVLLDIQNLVGNSTALGTSLGSGIVQVGSMLGGLTISIGPSGDFNGDWAYNILNTGAGVSDLYQSNPGNASKRAAYLGNFQLDSAGVLTFNPVPEPSTFALIGGGLLSLLAFRRRTIN